LPPGGGGSMNPNHNWENANSLLKKYCSKHYCLIENIKNPDFSNSCMRCLRETFLKKDPISVRQQAMKDIIDMKSDFGRIMEEFGIRKNIKEEFCAFTSNKIKHYM
jgi:hypothetical protein